ncbi:MAG: TIGR04086 family membrane protein [Syntrophomonadaceae bacterium]|jgi:putative membrane protein (TIGR04086 family)
MTKNLPVEIIGMGKSLIISLTLGIIIACVVYFSSLQESLLKPLANIVLIISIFYGGCTISKAYGNKGLIRGLAFGLAFFILMLLATFVLNSDLISAKAFAYNLLICTISGGLGGIIGIGLGGK